MRQKLATAAKLSITSGASGLPLGSRSRTMASASIEAVGPRDGTARRAHRVTIHVELDPGSRPSARAEITAATRLALAGFAPRPGEEDARTYQEVSAGRRGKAGVVEPVVVAIEATAPWPSRPSAAAVEALTDALHDEGYRVVVRERRECTQSSCATDTMVPWNHVDEVPIGWCNSTVCGRHSHKTCTVCQSVYVCTSVNAAGKASAVHCQVCNTVLVEWGSSKVWELELISRGAGAVAARFNRFHRAV